MTIDTIKLLARYNTHANQEMGRVLSGLTHDEWNQALGGYFPSIRATLSHIFNAHLAYLRRFAQFWFLPTHGDGHYLGTARGARQVSFSYLRQIAQAADDLGFEGALIPTGRSCEDPWAVAAALVSSTRRLTFLQSRLAP